MKLLFISLGCDKNLVDSEEMLGMLAADGHQIVDDEDEAEVIIVNTCCFIGDAKEESVNTILEMAEKKKAGTCKVLIVTGCMAQRYKKEISEEIPEVDAILGTTSYGDIIKAVKEAEAGRHFEEYKSIDFLPNISGKRMLTTGGHFAYLKIAEGCDKHCTYCIIPKLRGSYRSVPMEQLVKEAQSLAEQGVKELILVAQETTLYGKDLYGKKSLHVLLKELCKIKGIRWIRILYCYPEEIYDELIQTMKELAGMKEQFVKVQAALEAVKGTGYGVVVPELSEITIEEPEVIRQGNKFGVKIRSKSPSIHMIRAGIETEIAPIVGTEQQAEDLIKYIKESPDRGESIWETNIFGKSIQQLVEDGIKNKLAMISEESQVKLQDTMQKIVNDSKGGLVCIII